MKVSFLSVLIFFFSMNLAAAMASQEDQSAHQHSNQGAPSQPAETMPDMPGMQHDSAHQQSMTFINEILLHDTAGTSAQPNSTAEPMIMHTWGTWMLMFHGEAFLSALQQSGPRGYDKVFSTNWFMPMAQR